MYVSSNISSTESGINIRIGKAWTAVDRLSTVWKSDLSDKIKTGNLPNCSCVPFYHPLFINQYLD